MSSRSAYENSTFCETFHREESGWRECKFCGKVTKESDDFPLFVKLYLLTYFIELNGIWYDSIFIVDASHQNLCTTTWILEV